MSSAPASLGIAPGFAGLAEAAGAVAGDAVAARVELHRGPRTRSVTSRPSVHEVTSSSLPTTPSTPPEIAPALWSAGWSVHVSSIGWSHGSSVTAPSAAPSGHGAPAWWRDHSAKRASTIRICVAITTRGSGAAGAGGVGCAGDVGGTIDGAAGAGLGGAGCAIAGAAVDGAIGCAIDPGDENQAARPPPTPPTTTAPSTAIRIPRPIAPTIVVVAVGVNGSSSGELCVCPHFVALLHSGLRALGVRESRKARRSTPGRARGRPRTEGQTSLGSISSIRFQAPDLKRQAKAIASKPR